MNEARHHMTIAFYADTASPVFLHSTQPASCVVHPMEVLFILTEEQSLSKNDWLSHLMSATPRDNELILQEEVGGEREEEEGEKGWYVYLSNLLS